MSEETYTELKRSLKELSAEIKELKKDVKSLKKAKKQRAKRTHKKRTYHRGEPFKCGFNLDLSHLSRLGEEISASVAEAMEGVEETLEGIGEMWEGDEFHFHTRPRTIKVRKRVEPGVDIRVDEVEEVEYDRDVDRVEKVVLAEIPHGKEILEKLVGKLYTPEELRGELNTIPQEEYDATLAKLVGLNCIIQEQAGRQRYLITRVGRKVLTKAVNGTATKDEGESNE